MKAIARLTMSYDYSVFKAPGPGPMSSWSAAPPSALGTLEEVTQRLSEFFPQVPWRWSGKTCFGRSGESPDPGFEFQITPDDDGLCRFLTVRHVTRSEVEGLCRMLNAVAVDDQKMELIRP
jgi:hypothetical protein